MILAQKPDLICMQEVIYDSYDYMKKELKGYTSYGFTGPEMDPFTEVARQEQTKLIIKEAAQYAEDFPQILCGDFNSGPAQAAAGFLHEAGWRDAYVELGIPERNSFHGFKGENYKKNKKRIDFVFMHGGVKAVSCKMNTDTVNGI